MLFPSKEIMEAYEKSEPFSLSGFAQNEGFLCSYKNFQAQYALILERKDTELEKQLRELIGSLREMYEYEKEHSFTEGWKMAKDQE